MVCVWNPNRAATDALEHGRVVIAAGGFALHPEERALRNPALVGDGGHIALAPDGRLKYCRADTTERLRLKTMMARFAAFARDTVEAVAPHYHGRLIRGRTSFRPAEIEGREIAPLQDDRRLHVDAFAAAPMRGRRILRVFANVNERAPRLWQIGEPFHRAAARFLPQLSVKSPALNAFYAAAGLTRGRRAAYDDLMLGLHDALKRDAAYQADCAKEAIAFAPGAVWLCFTDQVMHAALKGQFALEQTFALPIDAMTEPARSPLRMLEAMTGRALV